MVHRYPDYKVRVKKASIVLDLLIISVKWNGQFLPSSSITITDLVSRELYHYSRAIRSWTTSTAFCAPISLYFPYASAIYCCYPSLLQYLPSTWVNVEFRLSWKYGKTKRWNPGALPSFLIGSALGGKCLLHRVVEKIVLTYKYIQALAGRI